MAPVMGFLRPETRDSAHAGMAVDHGFHFLGIDLEAADIDDAAAPADEIIAVAAQFHHVAGIHPAILSSGLRCRRHNRWRCAASGYAAAVHHPHFHRRPGGRQIRGKPFQPIGDFKAHARFGRGIGMADGGMRETALQAVEHRLVGDLAREAHIARRDRGDAPGSSGPGANATACRSDG